MRRLIIFLIRRYMGLKKYEPFQFANQKSNALYFFNEDSIVKDWHGHFEKSSVSLNWLLDPECEIVKRGDIYEDR